MGLSKKTPKFVRFWFLPQINHLFVRVILSIFTFFLLLPFGNSKPAYFRYTLKAQDAYQLVINLRLEEAEEALDNLKLSEPDNLIVYHIADYIDFFKVFITEDKSLFKKLEKNKYRRLRKIRSGEKSSPYYLYAQAEINLHWALLRIKFGEYLSAFNEVSDAYQLLKKNDSKFPDFMANKKSLGILHSIVGTVPDKYRWGIKLIGKIDGSIPQGKKEIESVLAYAENHDFTFREETEIMYAFLLLHLSNQGELAWDVISKSRMNPKTNPLGCFVQANIALHAGKSKEAEAILRKRPYGKQFFDLPYLHYMMGLTKLYRLDASAEDDFLKFLKYQKGASYIKEAYQKLAWNALIHGNEAQYKHYMNLCKTKGNKRQEGDEAAYDDATRNEIPDVRLLKARMLFDGGYYRKAHELLEVLNEDDFATANLRLEFLYRSARVSQKLDWYTEAIMRYLDVLEKKDETDSYYPCNAALQIGIIYEELGNIKKARAYFKKTLKIKPDEYRTALHGKAKAGLNRTK